METTCPDCKSKIKIEDMVICWECKADTCKSCATNGKCPTCQKK